MMKVRLLKNVEAEGELIPVGTVCELEQAYDARDEQPPTVDLFEPVRGVMFWTFADEVEEVA